MKPPAISAISTKNLSLIFDDVDFSNGYARFMGTTAPETAKRAIFRTWAFILRDAIVEEPRAPHKRGFLWNSQTIMTPYMIGDEIVSIGGFSIVYAGYLHDKGKPSWNWTLAGSGPRYLSTKLARNAEKYLQIAAREMAREWPKGKG